MHESTKEAYRIEVWELYLRCVRKYSVSQNNFVIDFSYTLTHTHTYIYNPSSLILFLAEYVILLSYRRDNIRLTALSDFSQYYVVVCTFQIRWMCRYSAMLKT